MESSHTLVFIIVLVCVSNASSSVEVSEAKKVEEISLRQIYADMDKGVKSFVRENIKSVIRVLGEKSQEFNVSTKCVGNAFKLLSGLRDLKVWALNFVDATGKPNDGILSGNLFMYGNYDQCLNSSVLKKNGSVDFRGQYCVVSVATHLPKPELTPDKNERTALVRNLTRNLTEALRFFVDKSELFRTNLSKIGLCVPSGCDTNDIDKLVKYVGKQVWLNLTLDYCETEDSLIYFTPTRIVILCIYVLYIILVIVSSVVERYSTSKKIEFKNPVMRGLICFSLPYNFQKFTSTKSTEGNLTFLNGVRVLSLFYVILGHHYCIKLLSPIHRNSVLKAFSTWAPSFIFQIIINAALAVDVFFFIGGFLNCYVRKKKKFTYFSVSSSFIILIHRLMRINPVYIFIILLKLLLNPRGPVANYVNAYFWDPCKTEWWKNLIFINNFYGPKDQCIPSSWYLAADMQFFIISLFTIPLLFRYPKIGLLVHLVIILLSTAYTSFQAWVEKIMPTVLLSMDARPTDYSDMFKVYYLPFGHASAYFGGVLLGYFATKKRNLTLSKKTLALGWIVASAVVLTMIFMTRSWHSEYNYTRQEGALYFSTSRVLCSWCVGWVIFCCLTGHGGFVNYILSWKVWIPLNRLCLSAYLLSAIIQLYYFGNLRNVQDFQHEIEIWGFFGDVTVTCLLSVPMLLLFESPFITLEKVIFHKKVTTSKENEMKDNGIFNHEKDSKRDNDESSTKL